MSRQFLSPLWYRVADLRPRLAPQLRVRRHRYGPDAWYVLEDRLTERSHRLSLPAYLFAGRLDGRRTVDELWRELAAQLGPDAPSQEDIIQLLAQLYAADLLRSDRPIDVSEAVERRGKHRRMLMKRNLLQPLSFQIPLFDPGPLLARLTPLFAWLVGPLGFLAWLVLMGFAIATALAHWPQIEADVAAQVFTLDNLWLGLVVYFGIKALHEIGHGVVAARYGAPVREVGVMLLVLFPVPYVDASAAAALPRRTQRAAIAAAGILAETSLAALALFVWTASESASLRAICLNVMTIGGLSTIFINGNPLLRFDGYYVFCDLMGLPNLGQRSNRYLGHLMDRYAFGAPAMRDFPATLWERFWFLLYAPAAFVYRIFLLFVIAIFLIDDYFVVGALLAVWAFATGLVWPIIKGLWHVGTAPVLRRVRTRAVGVTGGLVAGVLGFLFLLPAPSWVTAQGIVWLPEESRLRAPESGFVREIALAEDHRAEAGATLLRLEDPLLAAQLKVLSAEVEAHLIRRAALLPQDRAEAQVAQIKVEDARTRLRREQERAAGLVLDLPLSGQVEPARPLGHWPNRLLRKGEEVAVVVPERASAQALVIVHPWEAELVRSRLREVHLLLWDAPDRPVPGRVLREVPGGIDRLPDPALATGFGGTVQVDPRYSTELRTIERVFQFDIAFDPPYPDLAYGGRVTAKFRLEAEPAGVQVMRRLRQLLLGRIDV